MRLLWLRWRYSFEMVNAYLASHWDDASVMANHLSAAESIRSMIIREQLN